MSQYQKLNGPIMDVLIVISGKDGVTADKGSLAEYSSDSSHLVQAGKKNYPEVVVKPRSAAEISEIVKLANRHKIPITPRSAGTGLAGGCIPVGGGIVLSLEKLNHVIEVDEENRTITLEAGVPTNKINECLKNRNIFYAGFPMSLQDCMIGGNIATNAGGGKAVKYGVTGRHVLGLEFVTPTGEIVKLGGKNRKDKAGYNLKELVVGSEGTLGIITKAIINLEKKPNFSGCALAFFGSNQNAAQAILSILSLAAVPSSLELIDRKSFMVCNSYMGKNYDMGNANCALLISFEEETQRQVNINLEAAIETVKQTGALDITRAGTKEEEADIWSIRQSLANAKGYGSEESVAEDIVVPYAYLPAFMEELRTIEKGYHGLMITNCGHAADGNLHTTLHRMPGIVDSEWKQMLSCARAEIYAALGKLGGKLTGEHGIGLSRVDAFKSITSPVELNLMKSIKKAWDPNNIMNPGKMFLIQE